MTFKLMDNNYNDRINYLLPLKYKLPPKYCNDPM